jgi:hypothetical protein
VNRKSQHVDYPFQLKKESITPHPIIKQQLKRKRSPQLRLLVPSLLPPCVPPATKTPVAGWTDEVPHGATFWSPFLSIFHMPTSHAFFKTAPQLMQPHIINMTCWPQPTEPHKALRSSCRSSSAFRSASKRCSSAFCRSWNGAAEVPPLGGSLWGWAVELLIGRGWKGDTKIYNNYWVTTVTNIGWILELIDTHSLPGTKSYNAAALGVLICFSLHFGASLLQLPSPFFFGSLSRSLTTWSSKI